MSKTIEDAAQDFAAINEDKTSNSALSYNKYDIAYGYQQGADFGYSLAENRIKKEYEEKLRWIPATEKLPEDCPELFLKKCMSKNVLVKRKWNDTGEIVIEINSRFSPSVRIGFLWNYDYKDSEVIEWRSFL